MSMLVKIQMWKVVYKNRVYNCKMSLNSSMLWHMMLVIYKWKSILLESLQIEKFIWNIEIRRLKVGWKNVKKLCLKLGVGNKYKITKNNGNHINIRFIKFKGCKLWLNDNNNFLHEKATL